MLESIFTKGWEWNVLLYGVIYLLAQYAVYKIIFPAIIGKPKSYSFIDRRYWYRRATFISAVIFAPIFEEIMFTYLAYTSFLSHTVAGKEGVVILFVAAFFASLHLPGDLKQLSFWKWTPSRYFYLLAKFQLHRFYYSLSAFFIFKSTGFLLLTIALHYLFNGLASFYNYDIEDQPYSFQKKDIRLLIITGLNLGIAVIGHLFFHFDFPTLGILLQPLTAFIVIDSIYSYLTE